MSLTSQIGDLGVATQEGWGSDHYLTDNDLAQYLWFPTLRIPQFAARNADELPKEISGRRGGWGSYVTNVAADGTVEMLGRGRSLIPIFMSLMGSGISAVTGTGNNCEQWLFDASEDYNWLSLWKNVGDDYAERYGDALVDGVTITMNNSQPARFAFDMLACNSLTTAKFKEGGGGAYLDNSDKVRDAAEPLMVVGDLAQVYLGKTIPGGAEFLMPVRNAEFRLSNGSSRDEFVIGSLTRHDVTKLDLIMQMTAEVVITDGELYGTVMYDDKDLTAGKTMTTHLTAMEDFYIKMKGHTALDYDANGTAMHNMLKVQFGRVQVVTFPFELQGNNLLTAQVMIRGHLQADGSSPVSAELICAKAGSGDEVCFLGPGYANRE